MMLIFSRMLQEVMAVLLTYCGTAEQNQDPTRRVVRAFRALRHGTPRGNFESEVAPVALALHSH